MIEPVRMAKIYIIGSKRVLDDTIGIMHSLGVIHIEDYKPGKYKETDSVFDIGSPFGRAAKYSEQLVRVRSLIANLKISKKGIKKGKVPKNPEKRLARIEYSFNKINRLLKEAEKRLLETKRLEEPLEFASTLKVSPEFLQNTEHVVIFKGIVERDFEKDLKTITENYELLKTDFRKKIGFVLLVERVFEKDILAMLVKNKYKEINIPQDLKSKTIADLKVEKEKYEQEIKKQKDNLNKLIRKEAEFLVGYEYYLKKENEKAEAPLRFATTPNSFIVEGYVPVKKYETLKTNLEQKLGNKICVERTPREVDFAPTELKNPRLIDAFEFFLNLYSLPFYKELDPTFIVFLTFPLFFGFMLGDIGYGMVTAVIFLIVKLKTKSNVLKGLMNAMILASIATIGFGFVFGEFFGGSFFGLEPLIHREHDFVTMLLITILVGIIHVNIGFVLGFFNVKRLHGLKKAILEKGGWIVTEVGAFLMLFQIYNFFYTGLPYQLYLGLGFVLAGIGMLVAGHGALGLIELPSVASNVLSYARLFAIGLASVALAVIINKFATGFIQQGGFMFIPAILILVMGHALNIAIGIIGSFLQSLRLHYVEFFTKFYKGGGRRYTPFGR